MRTTHLTTLFVTLLSNALLGQLSDSRTELLTDVEMTVISHSAYFADVNDDGCRDMIIHSDNYKGVILCSGGQVYSLSDYISHSTGRGVSYSDAFNEGKPVLYASKGFFEWNGQGFDKRSVFIFNEDDVQCQIHDLDNSAGQDIITFDETQTELNVHFHLSQTGHSTRTLGTHSGSYTFMNTGFVDNNTRRDVITVNNRRGSEDIRLYINQGFKNFDEFIIDAPTDFQDYYAAIIDIDNDRDGDLIISGSSTYALRNNNGTFGSPERILPRISILSAKTGDIDQDGLVDLFILSQEVNGPYEVGYAINNGDGTMSYTMLDAVSKPAILSVVHQQDLDGWTQLADIDGDGDLDGIVSAMEENKILLYTNELMTSVEDVDACPDLAVLSSLTSDQVTIKLSECSVQSELTVDLKIFDTHGRLALSRNGFIIDRSSTDIDISVLRSGLYFVLIRDEALGRTDSFELIKITR